MKTGTILICKVNNMPLVRHQGIVIDGGGGVFVAHNTPMSQNAFGGNTVIEPLWKFTEGRTIIKTEHTNVTEKQIIACATRNRYRRFDSLGYNCFQFIADCHK